MNALYSFLLYYFGFRRKLYAGAVLSPERKGIPFDHMLFIINIEDDLWLTDVRFSVSADPKNGRVEVNILAKTRGEEYWYEVKV